MAKPKQASDANDVPQLIVEDSQPAQPAKAEPVKVETRVVNGIEMTFEDY